MADFLFAVDKSLFYFINGTISNPLCDVMMPFLTDFDKTLLGKGLAAGIWLLLIWRGGSKGRIAAVLLVPLIVLSDQLSSSVIKNIVDRPRPCHAIEGTPVLLNIRLLVDCGSGFSFPSSHAVNNFAAALHFSYFYRKWAWAFALFAFLVSISRVYVGVHFPSDVVGGAIIGFLCSVFVLGLWTIVRHRFPKLGIDASNPPRSE